MKNSSTPKVQAENPEQALMISGVNRWWLYKYVSEIRGVFFTQKPSLFASTASPWSEFNFRQLEFQIDHTITPEGEETWIRPKDGLPHPVELQDLRSKIENSISPIA